MIENGGRQHDLGVAGMSFDAFGRIRASLSERATGQRLSILTVFAAASPHLGASSGSQPLSGISARYVLSLRYVRHELAASNLDSNIPDREYLHDLEVRTDFPHEGRPVRDVA